MTVPLSAPKTPRRPQTTPIKSTTTPVASKGTKSTAKKSKRKPSAPSLTPAELAEQAQARAIADAELARERELNTYRLKNSWERIFEKYGKDFDGVADEVDIRTGKVFVDNGHLRAMPDESDKDSDLDGVSWRKIISPEEESKPRKNKRKRDEEDDGREEDDGGEEAAVAKTARIEETLCGENGTYTPCGSNSPDILPMSAIMGSPLEKTPRQESIFSTDTPRSSKLLIDDHVLPEHLGECGPTPFEILGNSGAKSNIQRSPGIPAPKPMTAPRAELPRPHILFSSPAPMAASSPLAHRVCERAGDQQTNITPNTAPSKLGLERRKSTVIPDDELDELQAPNSPTVSSSSKSDILTAKSTLRKRKTRLSISISAEESEDELSAANTPTVSSSRPTPTTSKPPSISTSTFRRLTTNTPKPLQAPRPKPALTTEKPKITPRRRSPPAFNVWAPLTDDPFYDPKWHDEHPDGTPRQFPSPVVDSIFITPAPLKTPKAIQARTSPIAESPIIKDLKRDTAIASPSRRKRDSVSSAGTPRRNTTVVAPSSKNREKEPVTPGWTSSPLRTKSGLVNFLRENEPRERSLTDVKTPARPKSQTKDDGKVNTPIPNTKGTTPTPPSRSSAIQPRSASNRLSTRSSPVSSESELEIVRVRRVNCVCRKKGIRYNPFCFKCSSASNLPV